MKSVHSQLDFYLYLPFRTFFPLFTRQFAGYPCKFRYICAVYLNNCFYMLIYNTTYHVGLDDARNFVIWLNECYIPEAEKGGELTNPRILRILSHQEPDSECFSLQFEVTDSAALHRWHTRSGASLNEEMMKIFKDKVIGFPTLMEVIK